MPNDTRCKSLAKRDLRYARVPDPHSGVNPESCVPVTSLPKMRTFLCGNGCENTSEKRLSSGDFRCESRLRHTIALSALLVLVH